MVLPSHQLPCQRLTSAPNPWLSPVSARWGEEEWLLLPPTWASPGVSPAHGQVPPHLNYKGSHSLAKKKDKKRPSDVPLCLTCICCSVDTAMPVRASCRSKHLPESEDLTRTLPASPADHCQRLSVALLHYKMRLPDVFHTLWVSQPCTTLGTSSLVLSLPSVNWGVIMCYRF